MLQVERLRGLVLKHTVAPHWSRKMKGMTRELIDWISIEKEMGRGAHHCRNKWKYVKNQPGGAPLLPAQVDEESSTGSGSDEEGVRRSDEPETPASSHRARWTAAQVIYTFISDHLFSPNRANALISTIRMRGCEKALDCIALRAGKPWQSLWAME